MKTCSKCSVPKPESDFYVRSDNGKLCNTCKTCEYEAVKARRLNLVVVCCSVKTCNKCGVPKAESEFHRNATSLDGLKHQCKSCARKSRAAYYQKNSEAMRLDSLEYYKKFPERYKQRYRNDPAFRIRRLLKKRLWAAVKRVGADKSSSTLNLLGCPEVWLEIHLGSMFKSGMTWENYGPVWHVDHVRPCASFEFTDPNQQRECFHWTNLQPLFAKENIQKGDRLPDPYPYTPYSQTTCDPHIFKAF